MILLVALLAAILVGWYRGGSLNNLQHFSFRCSYLAVGAFALQLVIFSPMERMFPGGLIPLLHGLTYLMLATALLLNRQIPGVLTVLSGLAANFAAIIGGGGYMPATETALLGAGLSTEGVFHNSVMMQDNAFWFLGDVFYVPAWVPGANVFSIGDVLIALGIVRVTSHGMGAGKLKEPHR